MRNTLFLFILFIFSFNAFSKELFPADTNLDYTRERARKMQENADNIKKEADQLKQEYAGYLVKAKKCNPGAVKEVEDGIAMSDKAIKDCEKAKKIAAAAEKCKGPNQMLDKMKVAQEKLENAHYYIKLVQERRKEVRFEMKGCD